MIFDTHAHYDDDAFDEDRDTLLGEIFSSGICCITDVGASVKSSKSAVALSKKWPQIYAAVGVHPDSTADMTEEDIETLRSLAQEKKVVAIGEIGLDYHYEDTDKEMQRMVFNRQLEIAEKFNKPVVVHSRDSIGETYNILSKYNLKGSIHCFSGSLEMAKLFIKLGYKLGVGGIITFKNAKNIKEVVKNVDLSYILLETDSPYLSPEPFRGQRNEPKNIPLIAKRVSEITNIPLSEVERVSTENAYKVFPRLK